MVQYNPFDVGVQRGDTYKAYEQLREEAPCYHIEEYLWSMAACIPFWIGSNNLREQLAAA
ncbi:MAG: hypothetical protein JRH10_04615 [Deltaproteobacteria bacterium]|nr:hypothetical protein [Deltaproteobacteria bacterium]MBW2446512.1 hypothetical protein [Deltaproteobacteria bacterium]